MTCPRSWGWVGLLLASGSAALLAGPLAEPAPVTKPQVGGGGLDFRLEVSHGRLLALSLLPEGVTAEWRPQGSHPPSGAEVALQITGENWPEHHAQKLIGGGAGIELTYRGQKNEPSPGGHHTILQLEDPALGLQVESHYQFYDGIPVVRRWTHIVNRGTAAVGLEHVSSAMLYRLANFGPSPLEQKLRIHHASNSWQSEAQWRTDSPAQLGNSDNGEFNLNAISYSNVGTWSSMTDLPEAMVENRDLGVTWFWQIEHSGSWHWELGDSTDRTSYLYLGGPDELHAQAWKNLLPGQTYETVPVAVGCVRGGMEAATAALTDYRRQACLAAPPRQPALPSGVQ